MAEPPPRSCAEDFTIPAEIDLPDGWVDSPDD